MPKVNKVLHGDVDNLAGKLSRGITTFGAQMCLRDSWTSEADGKKCIVQVYEKLSLEQGKPHFSLTVALFDTGEEVRLFATTSGGSKQYWGIPYPDGEGELSGVLTTVLNVLDDIIM